MGWSDGGITGILLAEKRPDKVKKGSRCRGRITDLASYSSNVPNDAVKPMPLDVWAKITKSQLTSI